MKRIVCSMMVLGMMISVASLGYAEGVGAEAGTVAVTPAAVPEAAVTPAAAVTEPAAIPEVAVEPAAAQPAVTPEKTMPVVPKAAKSNRGKKGAPQVLRSQSVVSIDAAGQCIMVKSTDGVENKVMISDQTKYKKGKVVVALADVQAGQKVTVFLKKSDDGMKHASTIMVLKPRADGTGKKRVPRKMK